MIWIVLLLALTALDYGLGSLSVSDPWRRAGCILRTAACVAAAVYLLVRTP